MRHMTLRAKLLTIGVLVSVIPLTVVGGIVYWQSSRVAGIVSRESRRMAYAEMDHIAEGVYRLCETRETLLQESMSSNLSVARLVFNQAGPVTFNVAESVSWEVKNQYLERAETVTLPKMMVGPTWLGQNREVDVESPVVDEVQRLAGVTCTIFQRMNDAGDMLRVCTNVLKLDGTRAIGTYIPKTNPDGKTNPVVATVLGGETYLGEAFVVNKKYITAYEPIRDAAGKVVGALYVGIPQESGTALRQAIKKIKVGETGYVYVLNSKGDYLISAGGKRDGESIWEEKDDDGVLFIQEMCKKAVDLQPGEMAEQQYSWKNPGDPEARVKVARIVYFAPWDWVIGVGSYADEFERVERELMAAARAGNLIQLGIGVGVAVVALVVWFLVASGLTGRIMAAVNTLTDVGDQVVSASAQVADSSQHMASGASEQASALEESSASLEEMASTTRQTADNASQANGVMKEAGEIVSRGNDSMVQMSSAIREIKQSADETARIIKTIDEVAFQTNLLALNAAVEAARAGEAGKGFAVVAEEVRNLAQRSAQAAKDTAQMIETSQANAERGVQVTADVSLAFGEIQESATKVAALVGEIAAATNEQAQGIDEVNSAVAEMDKVTQSNAANSEEAAGAAEELSAQANELSNTVRNLVAIVGGRRNGHSSVPDRCPAPAQPTRKMPKAKQSLPVSAKRSRKRQAVKVNPEQIVPLNEDELVDF